jgi:hypothetical protein
MNSTNGGNTVQSTILGVKHMPSDNNNDDNPLDEDSLLDVCDSPENKRHQYAQRSVSSASKSSGNCTLLDDRRMRRQIANCNERRRMQSINAGFQALRQFLPQRNGEKLSKAAILQQTAELIQTLQLGKGQQELSDMEAERPQCKKRRVGESLCSVQ